MSNRWFIDTEFDEDGKTIELISIALVPEQGEPYYAVSNEFDPDRCNDSVKQNVLPKLPDVGTWMPRRWIGTQIKQKLIVAGKERPEIWGYFADYDWVAFCQLYGRMLDLPPGFPMYCLDLKQLMHETGTRKEQLPVQDPSTAHGALADAQWVRDSYLYIRKAQAERTAAG